MQRAGMPAELEGHNNIKLAIFDLGNVVFTTDFNRTFESWAGFSGLAVEQIRRLFSFDKVYEAFERGEIDPQEFCSAVCRALAVKITPEQFFTGWNSLFGDVDRDIATYLSKLRERVKIVAFSNTNEVHSEVWTERYAEILREFDKVYTSHTMKRRKPEAESFHMILEEAGVRPDETIFFDDSLSNVQGAREVGIRAFQVDSPFVIPQTLISLGLI